MLPPPPPPPPPLLPFEEGGAGGGVLERRDGDVPALLDEFESFVEATERVNVELPACVGVTLRST